MIKIILICSWACFVTLAGTVALDRFNARGESAKQAGAAPHSETAKTKEINIPKLKDNQIRGYVVVQANYSYDTGKIDANAQRIDLVVVDEIFKFFYDDHNVDFEHLDNLDLGKVTKQVMTDINKRVGGDAVSDLGLQELTFEPGEGAQRPPTPLEKR